MSKYFVSCDTFVAINENEVIFGKNADRPKNEVQEIVYFPSQNHEPNSKLKCTYIEINQVERTYAVVLSKPSWMSYGAESGSNEYGVVVGNEAIYNINTDENEDELKKPGLLGQDLLRLVLERSKTSAEGVSVLTNLLSLHGQSGICAEQGKGYDDLTYENSFLIADPNEAWIIETVGKEYAAEKVTRFRNISNCLTITTKIDKESEGLRKLALDKNIWDGKSEFNFQKIFQSKSGDDRSRFECGLKYLNQYESREKKFDIFSMMKILRDEESGICRNIDDRFPSQGSQISVLSKNRQVHWFTGTPDPNYSVFKPFVFTKDIKLTDKISSPVNVEKKDWKHLLYLKHESSYVQLRSKDCNLNETLRNLEKSCVEELENSDLSDEKLMDLNELFNDSVDAELRFYK